MDDEKTSVALDNSTPEMSTQPGEKSTEPQEETAETLIPPTTFVAKASSSGPVTDFQTDLSTAVVSVEAASFSGAPETDLSTQDFEETLILNFANCLTEKQKQLKLSSFSKMQF